MGKETSATNDNSKESSPKTSTASPPKQKKNGGLMSKSTGDISQLTNKETKTTTKTKSTSKMNKLQTQQDLVKLTDKVDCLVKKRDQNDHKNQEHIQNEQTPNAA